MRDSKANLIVDYIPGIVPRHGQDDENPVNSRQRTLLTLLSGCLLLTVVAAQADESAE